MSSKKIITIFFSLAILILLLGLIFKAVSERRLLENNIEQGEENTALETEETLEPEDTFEPEDILEPEEILEPEDVSNEEVVAPSIPTSTPPTSTTKKQMIVIEKEN